MKRVLAIFVFFLIGFLAETQEIELAHKWETIPAKWETIPANGLHHETRDEVYMGTVAGRKLVVSECKRESTLKTPAPRGEQNYLHLAMAKLVVEVLDASDLMPKDGQGSASPFVEVEFDYQRHRTQTKPKDLSPSWNEKFVFNVTDPRDLPNKTIDVTVYNDRKGHRNFLGGVKISGVSGPNSESEAAIQRYPLDKRGLFSNIRGDIALKIFGVYDNSYSVPPQANDSGDPLLQEFHTHNLGDDIKINGEKKKKNEASFSNLCVLSHRISGRNPGDLAHKWETILANGLHHEARDEVYMGTVAGRKLVVSESKRESTLKTPAPRGKLSHATVAPPAPGSGS